MGTTVAVSFPLGRYHATRWDGGANTSDAEWPPSPWRILRALIAVWYSRWPELPAAALDTLLVHLGTPSAYSTPPVSPGSTRHYMPGLSHSRSAAGNTDLVIDAFLAVPPDDPLLIHWDHDLDASERATLAKLLELMPYLGRSESVCEAVLIEGEVTPDANWWRMGETGTGIDQVELLAPDGPTRRELLEATTVATRRARRLIPVGARRVVYGRTPPASVPRTGPVSLSRTRLECLRFDLASPVAVRAHNVVLATDALHGLIAKALSQADDPGAGAFVGRRPEGGARHDDHDHVHVAPVPTAAILRARYEVSSLVVWTGSPMTNQQAGAIVRGATKLHSRTGTSDGVATQQLLFAGAGGLAELAPEIAAIETHWISAMPYLPVRHRKRNRSDDQHLADDIAYECHYRSLPAPVEITRVDGKLREAEIAQFRRRRSREPMNRQRRGVYLRLRFEERMTGPIALGQLSHFGFGLFVPDTSPSS